jgi:multidrug efflux system outer membrane protein
MNTRTVSRFAVATLVAAVMAACATVPEIDASQFPQAPAQFKEQAAYKDQGKWTVVNPSTTPARTDWWKVFNDPVLDQLIERANRSNTSIQASAARLAQARALARITDADRYPQLGVGAGVGRVGGVFEGTNGPARSFGTVGANLGYELDLFGKLSRGSEAARLDARAQASLLVSTQLLVQADVAQAYLLLRALDDERTIVRETIAAYRGTLDLTERRYRAGDVAELDVARARTEVAATEADLLAIERRRTEVEHILAVLVGEVASTFDVSSGEWKTALPRIPAGVPSTVLARRPDVAAAQDRMLAAQQRVGVARAAWFPDVSLTANAGYASSELSDVFKWSARAWGIGALLSLPVFDGGRRDAGVKNADAILDENAAKYREQVLVAFRDVEDQLSALRLLSEQAEAQDRAVSSAARATALSDARYRNGFVSQLDLLDSQRSELRNRRQALQVRSAQYQATVGLVRALGGGWDVNT